MEHGRRIYMKRRFPIVAGASALSLVALTTPAQETLNAKAGGTEIAQERSTRAMRAERLGYAEKVSDLIGIEIENYEGEKLGKVDDLAVDLETGRIVEVVLSTGGFFGLAVMMVPVPPGALHHAVADKIIHLKSDKEKLKAAPRFGMSNWADLGQSNQVAEIYRYHGQEPYFTTIYQPTLGPDPTARLGHVQRATKLMGVAVKNVQGETLGKVEQLMVDLPAGRVVSVILSSGEFLELGGELSAVPPAAFQFNSEHEYLRLDVSKKALSNAPHFKASEWPDLGDPTYAGGIYRAYRVEPYFITNVTVSADNTARNVRDYDDRTLTPLDQGDSVADVDTTARIRKGIIAGKDMSDNARNVKIITNQGQVTLRGPVNTAEEKRLIGDIAINIALVENVDNQLEVK
jgi:hyperosmotically inducible protein